MGKLELTVQQMATVINDLTSSNQEFVARVKDLDGKQQELASMWQGEANTAFNQAFQSDKEKWAAFATLINQYITTLQKILETYRKAEETNVQTAKTRRC